MAHPPRDGCSEEELRLPPGRTLDGKAGRRFGVGLPLVAPGLNGTDPDAGPAGDALLPVGDRGVVGGDGPGRTEPGALAAFGARRAARRMEGHALGGPEVVAPLHHDGGVDPLRPEGRDSLPALCSEAGHGRPVPLVGPAGRHLGKDGVLGHKGPGRHHPEPLGLQQVLELRQGVVIVPVAVDRHRHGGPAAPL